MCSQGVIMLESTGIKQTGVDRHVPKKILFDTAFSFYLTPQPRILAL
jgi:hypothetical protein